MNKKSIYAMAIMALVLALPMASAEARSLRDIRSNAVSEYNSAKNEYAAVRQNYISARQGVVTAIQNNKALINADPEARDAVIEAVKDFGLKATDFLRNQLQTGAAYAEQSGQLSQETVDAINAQVADYLVKLDNLDAEIEAATTIAEIRTVRDKMVNEWQDQNTAIKWIAAQISYGKAQYVVEKLDDLRATIQEKRDAAEANGKDVADLDAFIAQYDERLADMKADLELASGVFTGIGSVSEFNSYTADFDQYMKNLRDDIKAGYNVLTKISKEIMSQPSSGTTIVIKGNAQAETERTRVGIEQR